MLPISLFGQIGFEDAAVLSDKLTEILETGNLSEMKLFCATELKRLDPEYTLSDRCDLERFTDYLGRIKESLRWIMADVDPYERNADGYTFIDIWLSNSLRYTPLRTRNGRLMVEWDFREFGFGSYNGSVLDSGNGILEDWRILGKISD